MTAGPTKTPPIVRWIRDDRTHWRSSRVRLTEFPGAFEAKHTELEAERASRADPEDADDYRAVHIFWVPQEARWAPLKARAPQPALRRLVDDAMSAVERDKPSLEPDGVGVLPGAC